MVSSDATGGLTVRFLHPPPVFGPTPIWWWSGERLDPTRLRWQLERFVEGGVGAVVVMNLAPSGPLEGCDADDPPFFSEKWWRIFRGVCADAADLGLKLYFYDQIGFSGANIQGEIVTRHPEFAGQGLRRVTRVSSTPITLECPPEGEPLTACAVPVDEAGRCTGSPILLPFEDGRVHWPGAERPHRVMLAYRSVLGFDYLSADACRSLLDVVHGAYEHHVGDYFGEVIIGSFQDELPSLPTWSESFASEFAARNGYDLVECLAALWEDYGAEAKPVRRDYHATRAALAEEAFFEPLYRWHTERGLICGFDQQDSSRAGRPVDTVEQYADYPRTHRWFGAPGSDHHGDAKIHSSLAHAYDRERVWIEAFHSTGWGGTLEETFDWLLPWLRAGATLYNPHAVYYSTRGGWWEWAPPATDWRQPYWCHYDRFATTVARLCSVFTLGRHVCDVAVLHPTATVQAGATLDGPTSEAERANRTYTELVGRLRWYDARPGVLDRACRDFDVLDDASLGAAAVCDGELQVGREAFAAVVLPACTEVDHEGAEQLAELATAGGMVVAVETVPSTLAALVDSGDVLVAPTADDVPELLAAVPPRVRAPVPTLLREVGDATVLFVPATSSRATRVEEEAGGSHRWSRIRYDFDPAAYARTMTVTVRGVVGEPLLWEVYSGRTRRLATRRKNDSEGTVEIEVPFDDAPGALVLWQHPGLGPQPAGTEPLPALAQGVETEWAYKLQVLDGAWRVRPEPTLDNRWGDFAYPSGETRLPFQRWDFRWCADPEGKEDLSGLDVDDAEWDLVRATFGPHGEWRPEDEDQWRPLRYSASRGIAKDPIHDASLGPKGHVPEEFLDFGVVPAGRSVRFRTEVEVPESRICYLAVAASARKEAWLGGVRVLAGQEPGYLALRPVSLKAGRNVLELRLTPEEDGRLRGSFAFVTDPEVYRRPEWLAVPGPACMGSTTSFATEVDVGSLPPSAGMVHLGSATPCRMFVNDVEIARQGGFYPYFTSFDVKRLGVYDIRRALRRGTNVLRVEASDLGDSVGVLVDGVVTTGEGRVTVQSGAHWQASRDGLDTDPMLLRSQRYDPAWAHAWRRPHPLPEAAWLEGEREGAGTVLATSAGLPQDRPATEWLRFRISPGAARMRCRVRGTPRLWIDGAEVPCQVGDPRAGEALAMEADLPGTGRAERHGALRVDPWFGHSEGAVLDGPAVFDVGEGVMSLGDWQEQGLAGYSGGIRYLRSFHHTGGAGRMLLDLGRVRGTAEAWVNGVQVGVRIWAPYVFDVTGLVRSGENELEVLVMNTLGPYMDAASPTHFVFPGQTVSGLFGPVRLLVGDTSKPQRSSVVHETREPS